GRRPGIGEIHDNEPVILAEHQVVGLQLASRGLHRLGHDHDPVAWLLHGPGDGLAPEGEEHRILRHRRHRLHQRTLGFLHGPLVGGYAPTTRPTRDQRPVLAAKIRISPSTEASAKKVLTGRMNPHRLRNRTPRTPWLSAAAPRTAVGVQKVGVWRAGARAVQSGACSRRGRRRPPWTRCWSGSPTPTRRRATPSPGGPPGGPA